MSPHTRAQDLITVPTPLRPGDKVGIISPSFCVKKKDVEKGIKILRAKGLGIKVGKAVFSRKRHESGLHHEKIEDLLMMFEDPEIRAIFPTRGGFGAIKILEHLDYEIIKKNPKIFVGYSDLTFLLLALFKNTNLMVFHGPMLVTKGIVRPFEQMLDYLMYPKAIEFRLRPDQIINKGPFEGRLMGGNLTVITHMLGTRFLPEFEGKILFLEDVNEDPQRIDRALTHLRLSGALRGVKGILFGEFIRCGPKAYLWQLLRELAIEMDIPCIGGLPIGHGRRNSTIPIPGLCRMDGQVLRIEPWSKEGKMEFEK